MGRERRGEASSFLVLGVLLLDKHDFPLVVSITVKKDDRSCS
jgi:hypothetical protein